MSGQNTFKIDIQPFKNSKITFKDGLNVIVGANGTGKTRLLNAIKSQLRKCESKEIEKIKGLSFFKDVKQIENTELDCLYLKADSSFVWLFDCIDSVLPAEKREHFAIFFENVSKQHQVIIATTGVFQDIIDAADNCFTLQFDGEKTVIKNGVKQ